MKNKTIKKYIRQFILKEVRGRLSVSDSIHRLVMDTSFHVKCLNNKVWIGDFQDWMDKLADESYSKEEVVKISKDNEKITSNMGKDFFNIYGGRENNLGKISYKISLLKVSELGVDTQDFIYFNDTSKIKKHSNSEYFACIDFIFAKKIGLRLFVCDGSSNTANAWVMTPGKHFFHPMKGIPMYETQMFIVGTYGYDNRKIKFDSARDARKYAVNTKTKTATTVKHELMHVLQLMNSTSNKGKKKQIKFGLPGKDSDPRRYDDKIVDDVVKMGIPKSKMKDYISAVSWYLDDNEFYPILSDEIEKFKNLFPNKKIISNSLIRLYLRGSKALLIYKKHDRKKYKKFIKEFYRQVNK